MVLVAQLAGMNKALAPEVETIFLLPSAPLQCISSTLVREISKLGGSVAEMVNPDVARALHEAQRPPRLEA